MGQARDQELGRRLAFHICVQLPNEGELDFADRLRKHADRCNFQGWPADIVASLVRDRFIAGLNSSHRQEVKYRTVHMSFLLIWYTIS